MRQLIGLMVCCVLFGYTRSASADPAPPLPQRATYYTPATTEDRNTVHDLRHPRYSLIACTSYGVELVPSTHYLRLNDGFEHITEGVVRFGPNRDLGVGLTLGAGGHPIHGLYDLIALVAFQMDLIHPLEVLVLTGIDVLVYPELQVTMRSILHLSLAYILVAPALIITMNVTPDGIIRQEIMAGVNLRIGEHDHLYLLAQASTPTFNRHAGTAHPAYDEDSWAFGLRIMHTHDLR